MGRSGEIVSPTPTLSGTTAAIGVRGRNRVSVQGCGPLGIRLKSSPQQGQIQMLLSAAEYDVLWQLGQDLNDMTAPPSYYILWSATTMYTSYQKQYTKHAASCRRLVIFFYLE